MISYAYETDHSIFRYHRKQYGHVSSEWLHIKPLILITETYIE